MDALNISERPTTWAISFANQDSVSSAMPSPYRKPASAGADQVDTSASTTPGLISAHYRQEPTGPSAPSPATITSCRPWRS